MSLTLTDHPQAARALVATVVAGYRSLHARIRAELTDLDRHGTAWAPGEETNTVSSLVVHLLGSEAEALRAAAGVPCERDRASEFAARTLAPPDLLVRLERADALLEGLAPRLAAADLGRVVAKPSLAPTDRRPAATWLVDNLAHAAEHVGQLALTAQLYRQARAAAH